MTNIPKLTIELVPSTCWFSNVRSEVSAADWDRIRKRVYAEANYLCEVCGGKGPKHPVEAHEVWDYNDKTKVQKLLRMVALCPSCHEVKHIGFAQQRGFLDRALQHLGKVNGWTLSEALTYTNKAFSTWNKRSQHNWTLDISYLTQYGITPARTFRGENACQ